VVQYGIFHRFTGEVIEPLPNVRSLLLAMRLGTPVSFGDDHLERMGRDGEQLKQLVSKEFFVTEGQDLLAAFMDHYVVRPRQNPAVAYRFETGRFETGQMMLVRISMSQRIFSPGPDELPKVVEEPLPAPAAALYLAADGTKTLREILDGEDLREITEAIDFLTRAHRQLIKFTNNREDIADPFRPCNIVPRNMYRSARSASSSDVIDFHQVKIDDAAQEFDFVEPTVNHAFRFPSEALGGLNYGARFCISTLRPDVLPLLGKVEKLEVLEVGGGTGSFSASFIEQARKSSRKINYQIVDLSPALIESQQQRLSTIGASVQHFSQDATKLNIPGRRFDLIIGNEVIADFPVASLTRNGNEWRGPGAVYLEKYKLNDESSPDFFLINAGAIEFLERAWNHLLPGGALIVSEYGNETSYPMQAYHLNHEEFSIHFGHLQRCAKQIGFDCRLLTLKDFLTVDDGISMLDGQEEQIMCLNHVLAKHGEMLPYALHSEREFKNKFSELMKQLELTGVTFSPLSNGFHFGPRLSRFMVLVMTRAH